MKVIRRMAFLVCLISAYLSIMLLFIFTSGLEARCFKKNKLFKLFLITISRSSSFRYLRVDRYGYIYLYSRLNICFFILVLS